jgi:hypothetical protein
VQHVFSTSEATFYMLWFSVFFLRISAKFSSQKTLSHLYTKQFSRVNGSSACPTDTPSLLSISIHTLAIFLAEDFFPLYKSTPLLAIQHFFNIGSFAQINKTESKHSASMNSAKPQEKRAKQKN